jgi:hypothetical protein
VSPTTGDQPGDPAGDPFSDPFSDPLGDPRGGTRLAPRHAAAPLGAEVDHLVVAAATLEQGAQWCEATFGVSPGPGGKHAGFGTHNRLLKIDSARFPRTYLEIIALDPEAPAPTRPRWFGLDGAAMQARLAQQGPRLVHVVARTTALDAHLAACSAQGLDVGEAIAASRPSPHGLLRWRIAVRRDGALLFGGALPTLIEWDGPHPTDRMATSPVRLQGLALAGLPAAVAGALGLAGVHFVAQSGAAAATAAAAAGALSATFETPRGSVTLESE